ncbi:lipid A deacylase LpxR family protein [Acidisphaera sp. S103]|uniref:lipid A deacylase LpxR family protein n=1 Tax=Acidisphaera sp. S103 TaxID=1747223 RepID=UPI00131B8AB0|nr:lipid A deacylase LpxR family protein [Acidisphaera sp. S103]
MKLTLTMAFAAAVLLPASFARAQPANDPAGIWTLQDENASIPGLKSRDHFYTNGLLMGWTSPTTAVPAVLADLGNAVWGDGLRRISFDLSQQIYTPMDTQATVTNPRDRPYAGLLTGDFSLLSDTARSRSTLTLSLGVAGPAAGAGDMQNGFHDLIGRPEVKDWQAQIPNTPVVELLHDRTWRLPAAHVAGLDTDVLPSLTVGAGDLRDYVQAGTTIRIGQGLDSDFGIPRPRPGLSGGNAYTPTRPLAWYVFAGVDAQAVGYDLLLQAAPFRSGPHVAPIWDVGEMQAGFAVMAAGIRLTVAYVAQTAEFHGQCGGIHQFVTAAVSIRF